MNGPYTLKDAKQEALRLSKRNPKLYYILYSQWGIYISTGTKRLHVFATSDSYGNTYWHGGKEKHFTSAQKIEDQNRTPTMR